MKKYTIRIQRTEYYCYDVDVMADSAADAIGSVRDRYDEDEFCDCFDMPYDVEANVYCTEDSEVAE